MATCQIQGRSINADKSSSGSNAEHPEGTIPPGIEANPKWGPSTDAINRGADRSILVRTCIPEMAEPSMDQAKSIPEIKAEFCGISPSQEQQDHQQVSSPGSAALVVPPASIATVDSHIHVRGIDAEAASILHDLYLPD